MASFLSAWECHVLGSQTPRSGSDTSYHVVQILCFSGTDSEAPENISILQRLPQPSGEKLGLLPGFADLLWDFLLLRLPATVSPWDDVESCLRWKAVGHPLRQVSSY